MTGAVDVLLLLAGVALIVRTTRMRGILLCHGLLAFVYNTAIISMVVGLLTSQ